MTTTKVGLRPAIGVSREEGVAFRPSLFILVVTQEASGKDNSSHAHLISGLLTTPARCSISLQSTAAA